MNNISYVESDKNISTEPVFLKGVFNVKLKPGKPKSENGDSYLINLKRKIFAVADSTEWDPFVAISFLKEFNFKAEEIFSSYPDIVSMPDSTDFYKKLLVESTNEIIKQVTYPSSSTFTCIAFVPSDKIKIGLVLHSGDSCLFKADIKTCEIKQITDTNLNLIGRLNRLSQVKLTEYDENTRFIICTDGIYELSRTNGKMPLDKILSLNIKNTDFDNITNSLIGEKGKNIEFQDDTTLLVVNPNNLSDEIKPHIYIKGGPNFFL